MRASPGAQLGGVLGEDHIRHWRRIVNCSFRRAHETNAFNQFPLITRSKLRDEARDRDIKPSSASSFVEELERLDREGAFSVALSGRRCQPVGLGTTPSCRMRVRSSRTAQRSIALPSWNRSRWT
jgi:hypothetical protein